MSYLYRERSGSQKLSSKGSSAFVRNVMAMLDEIEYRHCYSGEDLEDIYRLRYKSFRAHGLLLSESADQRMVDELDDAPNCYRFGVFLNNVLVSTVRLHHMTATTPHAPIMTVFGNVLTPRLVAGETFIDPSRLAIDPDVSATYRALPYVTLRLAVIANAHFNTTSCVSMIRQEHTAFYKRVFNSTQVGEPRTYPPFTMPIYLYESRCDRNLQPTIDRFPFFDSTAFERRMLFDRPKRGELAPLTILPTAKYLKNAA
ncbi:N-acyl amino acid synthase FeeM domain-containing protein [Chelativorans salis]|uniref:N-acyl amino acid synthase FeeM catalytic core domain-containing protein n=1 Tax=Chelativorans salis TaxID=2978478 RepID=A0ABT2LVW9_9HYPH|nr:hypothetical protein [Chelativorans sp. EGI FJ00035]MCT7377728.1 hypothetical protein [Chelativorans sp. EGI FJ00035]